MLRPNGSGVNSEVPPVRLQKSLSQPEYSREKVLQEMRRRAFFWTQRCSYDNGNPCSLILLSAKLVIIANEYSGCVCSNCGAECRLSAGRKDRFYSHQYRKQNNEKIDSYIIVCGHSRVFVCMSDDRSTETGKHSGQRAQACGIRFTRSSNCFTDRRPERYCSFG